MTHHLVSVLKLLVVAFLFPPVDPTADCCWSDASLPSDGSSRHSGNPHGHKHAAFDQCGWLRGIAFHRPRNRPPELFSEFLIPEFSLGNLLHVGMFYKGNIYKIS